MSRPGGRCEAALNATPNHYVLRAAESDDDLLGIIALNRANLRGVSSPDQQREHGFVSLTFDLPLLRNMNTPHPHVIASPAGSREVAAYALVLLPELRGRFADLEPMFRQLERLAAPGGPIEGRRYYIMGQVCVDREHRGQGLVARLYDEHRRRHAGMFDLMITEIDRTNTRSLRAHLSAGCCVLLDYTGDDGHDWVIVALDLARTSQK